MGMYTTNTEIAILKIWLQVLEVVEEVAVVEEALVGTDGRIKDRRRK